MAHSERTDPDFDLRDDYSEDFDTDAETKLDLTFEHDLDRYASTESDEDLSLQALTRSQDNLHRLPGDWQEFDYSDDDWDSY